MDRLAAGERLSPADIVQLSGTSDLLPLGMLADAVRRRLHGAQVTYLRVAACPFDRSFVDHVPTSAREVRVSGSPDTLDLAVRAVAGARAVAGERTVSGLSWRDIERLAASGGTAVSQVLERLRAKGLDALAEVPIDGSGRMSDVLEQLVSAGYHDVRLTVEKASAADRSYGASARGRGAARPVRVRASHQPAADGDECLSADDRV